MYSEEVKVNIRNLALDEDQFMKVCFVAWKSITKGRRLNDRKIQLNRFTSILNTKAQLDARLAPERVRRHGAIGIYSFLRGIRSSLLKAHFSFWRDISGLMTRKLARYFDKWNVWTSELKLRRMTASRFLEIVATTNLSSWCLKRYKSAAFAQWCTVGKYMYEMRKVALWFRVWKTVTGAIIRQRGQAIKAALREWRHIARENAIATASATQFRDERLVAALWGRWKLKHESTVSKKKEMALARINASNISKISSSNDVSGISQSTASLGVADASTMRAESVYGDGVSCMSGAAGQHEELSGMTSALSDDDNNGGGGGGGVKAATRGSRSNGSVSDLMETSSVLQQSLTEGGVGVKNNTNSNSNTPLRQPRRGGGGSTNATPVRTGSSSSSNCNSSKNTGNIITTPARRSSSGYGQSSAKAGIGTTSSSKQDLWQQRMASLKTINQSFNDENTTRLRASGLK
jgi:hypothetical protein